MEATTYRLVFEGHGTREEVTLETTKIAEAARIADEYRELLGWLDSDEPSDGALPARVTVRIEPVREAAVALP